MPTKTSDRPKFLLVPEDIWDEFVSVLDGHGIHLRDCNGNDRDYAIKEWKA